MNNNLSFLQLAYFLSAGGILAVGLATLVIAHYASHRKTRALYASFSLLCLGGCGYQIMSAFMFTSPALNTAVTAMRWQILFSNITIPAFFAYFSLYARQPFALRNSLLVAGVTLIFCVLNQFTEFTLRFAASPQLTHIQLAWGETGYVLRGPSSPAGWVWQCVCALVLIWCVWITFSAWQQKQMRFAVLMMVFLILQLSTSALCVLIDLGEIEFGYIAGFPLAILVAMMSLNMVLDSLQQSQKLMQSQIDLKLQVRERQIAENNVRRMAFEDYLTRLPNRMVVHERLGDLLARSEGEHFHAAFYLLDLDHFKTINDALGHDVGDEVLRSVGHRLHQQINTAALIARVGGDEFAVIEDRIEGNHHKQIELTALRILEIMAEPLCVGDHVLDVGCSIGIVVFPTTADTVIDVIRSADIALYEAKRRTRGSYFVFTPQMREVANERLSLEKGLRIALQQNQLSLYFQPQVDASGRQVGAEALIRWDNPTQGFISPIKFIRVAEETGLINPIGEFVLQRALLTLADWLRREVPFNGNLAINVSAWQFARSDFVRTTKEAIQNSGVPPERITLEVTETALMSDVHEVVDKLTQLREIGIKIALDDFGTGYSSLAYLRDLPLDILKIDKAFVDEVENNPRQPLVESMIAIGKHMHLKVVAEGVETPKQLNHLRAMGCHYFQGYFFAKALPQADFEKWLLKNVTIRSLFSQIR